MEIRRVELCSLPADTTSCWSSGVGVCVLLALSGCAGATKDDVGAEPRSGDEPSRVTTPANIAASERERAAALHPIALPDGYEIEAVARGLVAPSGVAFDDQGAIYVVESGYSPVGGFQAEPRLVRIDSDGAAIEIARGGVNGPWTGIAHQNGFLLVAESGKKSGGKILRIGPDGRRETLIENLPSLGDHGVNGPAVGSDGSIYFGIGTATNSGVVGEDNAMYGWLAQHPDFRDVPCADVVLRGANFVTRDLRRKGSQEEVETGAFLPFGTPSTSGQIIAGSIPCSGSVLRLRDGGGLELVAWGFRNPFGLAFSPTGQLYVTDNSYDVRGSRPVYGTGDLVWAVEPGRWYGWPDFHAQRPLDDADHFAPPGKKDPGRVLERTPPPPPIPSAILGVHSSSNGFDFSTNPEFGHVGEIFVAQFGDQSPTVGRVRKPVGFKVVRVDVATGVVQDFAVNQGETNGPASALKIAGLERPIAARFDPTGRDLYVVDFGVMSEKPSQEPTAGTGVLWRIRKSSSAATPIAQGGSDV